MPIYEYECISCHNFCEALQKVNDPPLKKCPHCGGLLKKRISAPALQFKGNGWYITDYARQKPPGKEEKAPEKKDAPSKEAE